MKIRYQFPFKKDDDSELKIVTDVLIMNKRFILDHENDGIKWRLISNTKAQSLFIVGAIGNGPYYWCCTIPFHTIFRKFPLMRTSKGRWLRKGISRSMLETIFNKMNLKQDLDQISVDNFKSHIKSEYGLKI